jgi:hypothetical protein
MKIKNKTNNQKIIPYDKAKELKKNKQVNFRIDEKSLLRFEMIATKKKISFTEFIMLSMESYIKK